MEFMNVGGGELLIIILLALVLFSPEDILKLMRSIGKYARTARQMWSNVSKSLQDDYIPDEVKDVVKETATTVKEARATLTEVRQQFNEMTTSVEDEVSEVSILADDEISEAVKAVNETPESDQSEDIILESETDTSKQVDDETVESDIHSIVESLLNKKKTTTSDEMTSIAPSTEEQKVPTTDYTKYQIPETQTVSAQDVGMPSDTQSIKEQDETSSLTKEDKTKTQDVKSSVSAITVNAKLAKVSEDSLKDDGNDS